MSVSRSSKGTKSTGVKLEDDELFKAIGGQLDKDFDYSEWQRAEGGEEIPTKGQKGKKGSKATGGKGKFYLFHLNLFTLSCFIIVITFSTQYTTQYLALTLTPI